MSKLREAIDLYRKAPSELLPMTSMTGLRLTIVQSKNLQMQALVNQSSVSEVARTLMLAGAAQLGVDLNKIA